MKLIFINWNVDPIAFEVINSQVRWYGLLFTLGFIISYFIGRKMFQIEKLKTNIVDSLFIIIFTSGIIGARLGHVFFYDWNFYQNNASEIIKTWHGGLASHGGAIGVLLALYVWSKFFTKFPFLWIMDKIVVCASLVGGLIRLGNLMNSEIYGIQTSLPWGFIFERNGETIPKHPTQIYEAISYFLIFILLYYLYFYTNKQTQQGFITGLFGILIFSSRFIIEFIKKDQSDFESLMIFNMGQWLSIPFIIYGIFLICNTFNKQINHSDICINKK